MTLARRSTLRTRPTNGWNTAQTEGLGSVFGDFERLFGELASPAFSQTQWAQGYPVDLYETDEAVVLEMAVPGIAVNDLDISLEGRQLSIRGSLPEVDHDGRRYWLQTIPHGQFQRTVTLPINVESDKVQATVENGMLRLTLPKVAEAKARKITINAGK